MAKYGAINVADRYGTVEYRRDGVIIDDDVESEVNILTYLA